jgi:hypothetical protein
VLVGCHQCRAEALLEPGVAHHLRGSGTQLAAWLTLWPQQLAQQVQAAL